MESSDKLPKNSLNGRPISIGAVYNAVKSGRAAILYMAAGTPIAVKKYDPAYAWLGRASDYGQAGFQIRAQII